MADDFPTQETPASGQAVSVVNGRRFVISDVDYWYDGSDVVVRSREFDCLAVGNDLQGALDNFLVSVLNFAEDLVDLEETGAATERELAIQRDLSDRLSRLFLAERPLRNSRGRLKRWRTEPESEVVPS